jgi:hypothetical protein
VASEKFETDSNQKLALAMLKRNESDAVVAVIVETTDEGFETFEVVRSNGVPFSKTIAALYHGAYLLHSTDNKEEERRG